MHIQEQKLHVLVLTLLFLAPVQDLLLGFYDMRDCEPGANVTAVCIDWLKRKTGIVRQRFEDDTISFKVLAKKDVNEEHMIHIEKSIYPDCKFLVIAEIRCDLRNFFVGITVEVPDLDRLYLAKTKDDTEIIDERWKILGSCHCRKMQFRRSENFRTSTY